MNNFTKVATEIDRNLAEYINISKLAKSCNLDFKTTKKYVQQLSQNVELIVRFRE